ncbi:MAG: ParA family protein [Pseudomonadales bacterium]|nr:ParA family protein [Pseudomonadales bacterium]
MTRKIVVANSKGGCGKTTIAVHAAAWFASQNHKVALVDYDVQHSALDWLKSRPAELQQIDGYEPGRAIEESGYDALIYDLPAGFDSNELIPLIHGADCLIIPVLPSAIDVKAVVRFLLQLQKSGVLENFDGRVGVVANRVRMQAKFYKYLTAFMERTPFPTVTTLRDTQSYVSAMAEGKTLFDLPQSRVKQDLDAWYALMHWICEKQARAA